MGFLANLIISATVIAMTVALGKRSTWLAAILISLPLSSIIAMSLLYFETRDRAKVLALSDHICLLILPSVMFYVALSLMIRFGLRVPLAMPLACLVMVISYITYSWVLKLSGVIL